MRKALLVALLPLAAGCASGKGRVETMFDGINPLDAISVVGLGRLAYEASSRSVWETEVASLGANRYRVTLRRNRFAESGDGEAPLLFRRQAERIAVLQSCTSWNIVEFEERYDSKLIGAQRVAEGTIECVKA